MTRFFRTLSALVLLGILLSVAAQPSHEVAAQGDDEDPLEYFFPLVNHDLSPYFYWGLDGGTVEGVVVDPNQPNILYAGSWGNGIYKSFDAGGSWENKNTGLASAYIYEIAIDPNDSNHILASVFEKGINETFDGGETWQPVNGLPAWCVVYTIDFDPTNSDIVYAGLRLPTVFYSDPNRRPDYPGKVYKSTDGGSNWVDKSSGLAFDYVYDLAIDPRHPNVLYTAMHRTGVYKSTNGGDSWTAKLNNLHDYDIRSVDVHPGNSTVYIGLWDGFGMGYSTNGGDWWQAVSSTVSSNLYVYEIQVDPNHPATVYLTTNVGIYVCESPHAGSTCKKLAHSGIFSFDLALDVSQVDANGRTSVLYTGLSEYGVFKSTNTGRSFEPSYQGIRANIIPVMLVDPLDPDILYVSVYGKGLFKSFDNGASWWLMKGEIKDRYVNDLIFRPGTNDVLYAGTERAGIFISQDAGHSWVAANSGLSRSAGEVVLADEENDENIFNDIAYRWMDPVDLDNLQRAMTPADATRGVAVPKVTTINVDPDPTRLHQMFAGTNGSGLFYSNNGGFDWQASNQHYGHIYDSLVDPSLAVYRYFVGTNGDGVRVSQDRVNWGSQNTGLPGQAVVLTLELAGDEVFFAGTDNGIYHTTDAGNHWQPVGLTGKMVSDIQIDTINPGMVWAATTTGLYQSLDGGNNWNEYAVPQSLNKNFLTILPIPGAYAYYLGTSGGNFVRLNP